MKKFPAIVAVVTLSTITLTGCSFKSDDRVGSPKEETPVSQAEGQAEPADAPEPEVAPEPGTIANPAPAGTPIDSKAFDGTTYSSTFALTVPSANQYVTDANMFNDAAPAGMHYAVATVTITNTSADSTKGVRPGSASYDLAVVDPASGQTYPNATVVVPTPISGLAEIYPGQTATGEIAFLVPDTVTQLLIVSGGVFVAL